MLYCFVGLRVGWSLNSIFKDRSHPCLFEPTCMLVRAPYKKKCEPNWTKWTNQGKKQSKVGPRAIGRCDNLAINL